MDIHQHAKVDAWLIRDCPNFHFMPSMRYDRLFGSWHDDGRKMSPEYWSARGLEVTPMVECAEAEAAHWLIVGKAGANYQSGEAGLFFAESADSARGLGKDVMPLRRAE